MNKNTALTFAAAVLLLAASLTINLYGHEFVARQRAAERELTGYAIYDGDDGALDSWENASVLIGLLALSVALAGAMLWDREDAPPHAARCSVLMLDESAPRRVVDVSPPLRNTLAAGIPVCESCARSLNDETLTPLERVIRSY